MFKAFFEALSFADIGTLALVVWAACEASALLYAISAMLKAPDERRFSVLRATYLWRSLMFSDAWKAYNRVPNVAIKTSSMSLGMAIFLGLGEFGFGTMLDAFGLSALCAISFTGVSHLTLLHSASWYRAAFERAKKVQDRLEFSA